MNNNTGSALAKEIVKKNRDVAIAEVYANGFEVITKPLVCKASNGQYRLIGQLKIKVQNVNNNAQIEITNLYGFPGIMHSSGNGAVSTDICLGNYNFVRSEIVKSNPNWLSVVNMMVIFCKSVSLSDDRGGYKFNLFPVLSETAATFILASNRTENTPASNSQGTDVQNSVTFPHGLDAPLWVFTEPVVQVSVEEYEQNREKYPDIENYQWELLRNMYGGKDYCRRTRPEREGLFNLYAEREAPVGHYIELEGKFYKVVETPTASQFDRNDIRHVVKKHRQYYVVLPDGKSVYRGSYHLNEACIRVVARIEMEINPKGY
jgi:hypothetical protein